MDIKLKGIIRLIDSGNTYNCNLPGKGINSPGQEIRNVTGT